MWLRVMCLAATSLFLSACGGILLDMYGVKYVNHAEDAAEVSRLTEASYDEYQQVTELTGPLVFPDNNILKDSFFLRASVGHTPIAERRNFIQLYIEADEDSWRYYDRAYINGYRFDLVVIGREAVVCIPSKGEKCTRQEINRCGSHDVRCSIEERVGLDITPEALEQFAQSGLDFQIAGYGGKKSYQIPAGYFAGFLEALNRQKASIAAAAPIND